MDGRGGLQGVVFNSRVLFCVRFFGLIESGQLSIYLSGYLVHFVPSFLLFPSFFP